MNNTLYAKKVSLPITEQVVGEETLVYNEQTHQAFCLNAVSSAVWQLCDGAHSVSQIAELATVQLAHPVSTDVVEFALEQLRSYGLLEVAATAVAGNTVSRRNMLGKLGLGAALMIPAVTMIVTPAAAQTCSPTANGCSTTGFGHTGTPGGQSSATDGNEPSGNSPSESNPNPLSSN